MVEGDRAPVLLDEEAETISMILRLRATPITLILADNEL